MNSENQFETIILKILESDPQLLVAASVVLVILIVIGVFFVKTLKKLFSDETQTPPLSEKDRLKKLDELAKEEEELREQRDEAKLQKISEKEDSAKLELQQQEVQLRDRQILQRNIPVEEEPEPQEGEEILSENASQWSDDEDDDVLRGLEFYAVIGDDQVDEAGNIHVIEGYGSPDCFGEFDPNQGEAVNVITEVDAVKYCRFRLSSRAEAPGAPEGTSGEPWWAPQAGVHSLRGPGLVP